MPSQVPADSEETGGDSALENATSSIRQHRLQLGVRKGVQWVTLWGADAARVAGDEEALRQAWKKVQAPAMELQMKTMEETIVILERELKNTAASLAKAEAEEDDDDYGCADAGDDNEDTDEW